MKCPYCGGKIRINTKYYPIDGKIKQAACANRKCGARGPMANGNESAKELFTSIGYTPSSDDGR